MNRQLSGVVARLERVWARTVRSLHQRATITPLYSLDRGASVTNPRSDEMWSQSNRTMVDAVIFHSATFRCAIDNETERKLPSPEAYCR